MAIVVPARGSTTRAPKLRSEELQRRWKPRIEDARRDRKPYEWIWLENLAMVAGKYWLRWTPGRNRQLVMPARYKKLDRYTLDELTQYRYAALGDMAQDDDRPNLLFRHDDLTDEEYAKQANDALGWGWENEFGADEILLNLKLGLVDLATMAVRVLFDPNAGPLRQQVPVGDQGPIFDGEQARAHVAELAEAGQRARIRDIHEGRVRWKLYSPFGILPPPGVEHARDFPWFALVEAVPLDKLKKEFGGAAADVKPEQDISSIDAQSGLAGDYSGGVEDVPLTGKLKDYARLYRCFELPCSEYPEGQQVVLAGGEMTPLQAKPLEYRKPDETPCTGVSFFHYHRVTGRFWSRSLVDEAKEPVRHISAIRTQMKRIISAGNPMVFHEEGTLPEQFGGDGVARVPMAQGSPLPQVFPGFGPGAWLRDEVELSREDLQRATGIHDATLGSNPANVGTYSQLALLHDADARKRMPVITGFKNGIKSLTEDTVYDIRRYWGTAKQVTVGGEENLLQSFVFNASKIPAFFEVEIASGAALPRSQAAKLKMIEDLAAYSNASRQPLPVGWYQRSLEAGEPLDVPQADPDPQLVKAQMENELMQQGQDVTPTYFDPAPVHIPVHRELEIQALMTGDQQLAQRLEAHVQQHLALEQQKVVQLAQAQQGPPGVNAPAEPLSAPGAAPTGPPIIPGGLNGGGPPTQTNPMLAALANIARPGG